jgi:hypothetical protein
MLYVVRKYKSSEKFLVFTKVDICVYVSALGEGDGGGRFYLVGCSAIAIADFLKFLILCMAKTSLTGLGNNAWKPIKFVSSDLIYLFYSI